MYKEVFVKTEGNGVIVAVYAGNGHEYAYFDINEKAEISMTHCLNNCYKNDYYLDYVSLEILQAIGKVTDLFEKKEEKKEENNYWNNYCEDDIPF